LPMGGRKGRTWMAREAAAVDARGICCPKCGRPVDSRYVAGSYPASGGHIRRRFCECGAEVLSLEKVVGANIDGFLVWGLLGQNYGGPGGKTGAGNPKSMAMKFVRQLGGKVKSL
jgi:hypothetical protein